MTKLIAYDWNLREVMANRGMFSTTKLIPPLRERGIELSSSQVYRLAAEKPERINVHVLVAICDILDCSIDELIKPVALHAAVAATGTDSSSADSDRSPASLKERGLRPQRVTIPEPPNA